MSVAERSSCRAGGIVLLATAALALDCSRPGDSAAGGSPPPAGDGARSAVSTTVTTGAPAAAAGSATPSAVEAEARGLCTGCHVFPDPELLPRRSWEHVLDWMGGYLGFPASAWPTDVPARPLAEREVWERVRAYYLEGAPVETGLAERPPFAPGLPGFRTAVFPGEAPSIQTLVKLVTGRRAVFVGEALRKVLYHVADDASPLDPVPLGGVPVQLEPAEGGWRLTLLGDRLAPTAEKNGSLVAFETTSGGFRSRPLLEGLHRAAHVTPGDLDGDGRSDLVVCEFGDFLAGRLAWFEALPEGGHRAHPLADRPGATRAWVTDADGDGRPDVVALLAQAPEQVVLYLNRGGGEFDARILLERHPAFSSTDLALIDLDGDGDLDLVLANGDLGDFPAGRVPLKPYQGVHVLVNDGAWGFDERLFYPMPAVMRVAVADLDADGRADIGAVATVTRLDRHAGLAGFVLLRQSGPLQFTPYTLPAEEQAGYTSIDVGDYEGDGDLDVALGGDCPPDRLCRALVLLENLRR